MIGARITVSDADFYALAEGNGDADSVLRRGQLSKRILLLLAVVDVTADRNPAAFSELQFEPAQRLLAAARRTNRPAVDQVIMQPQVGAWAEHCLRLLLTTEPPSSAFAPLGKFAALAASAAFAADLDFDVLLSPTDGTVTFPGFGVAGVASDRRQVLTRGRSGSPAVELDDGTASVRVPLRRQTDRSGWQPFRKLSSEFAGIKVDVQLDDVDPFRDPHGLGVTDRMSTATVELWQQRLDDAWRLLATHHRDAASAIAHVLRCFVPIAASDRAPELSATPAESFGAIYLTEPKDGMAFATTLVHEFQHTKLSALIDLVPLQHSTATKLYYAPWRADARPLYGLLQGTYAHLGITVFMDVQRKVANTARQRFAEFEFARIRDQVWRASATVATSRELTEPGYRFASAMRRRIRSLCRVPVDPTLRKWAAAANTDHWTRWRLANLTCDEKLTGWQAEEYLAGRPSPLRAGKVGATIVQARTTFRPNQRLSLTYLRLTDPAAFDTLVTGPLGPFPPRLADLTPGDVLLAVGRVVDASQRYRQAVVVEPDRLDLWAGLSMARRRAGGRPLDLLARRPELVCQVHEAVRMRSGLSTDPVDLADWIAAGR